MVSLAVRVVTLTIAVGCYSLSLTIPAYYDSAPAIDYCKTYTGWECLVSPATDTWMVLFLYPSWWANPLFFTGLYCICLRRDYGALACGCGAILFAVFFLSEGYRIRTAYWFWLASICTQMIGAFVLQWAHIRASRAARLALSKA